MARYYQQAVFVFLLSINLSSLKAQTITGAWKGKIGGLNAELKLIKKGDSLVGTSYYYTTRKNYRRYTVRGYFDAVNNYVVWWDDALLDGYGRNFFNPAENALLSIADFNCPGETTMKLEGSSTERDNRESKKGVVQLQKITQSSFQDEWDYVIQNYFIGANRPAIIDSVAQLTFSPHPEEKITEIPPSRVSKVQMSGTSNPDGIVVAQLEHSVKTVPSGSTIEQKFTNRTKKLQSVIPITSPKIEIRFYDNAQVDGDSISLFLNGRLLYKNIRLTEKAYTIFLQADELENDNELVMVAENLGSIPPNTAFMVAILGNKRYEARLFANEGSSALVRLVKQEVSSKQ